MCAMAGAVTGTNLKSARRSVRGARDSRANHRLGAINGDPLAKAAVTEQTGLRRTLFPSCVLSPFKAKSRPPRTVAISAGHNRIVRPARVPSQVAWQGGRAGTPRSTPPNGGLSTEERKPFRERREPGGNRV
jgi:hypothetical protein